MITTNNLKYLLRQQAELTKKIYPQQTWKYNSFEELILNCGKEFTTFSVLDVERGIPKSCYYNCQQLLREYPEFIYCEGYALAPDIVIPLKHSCLIDKQQEII